MDKLIESVDENFPCWKDSEKPKTYVTCPVFSYRDDHIPTEGASNYIPELYDGMDPHHYTKSVEEQVLNVFIRFGDYTNQPMFIFPDFKIKKAFTALKEHNLIDLAQKELKDLKDYETDLIIVHREVGIILVEVKSNIIKHYDKAKEQLEDREKILTSKKCIPCNPELQKRFIKKVIAYPCQNEQQELRHRDSEYIHLCKEHVNNFDSFNEWWCSIFTSRIEILRPLTEFNQVYNNLVPLLLCKLSKETFCKLNMKKCIQQELELQRSLPKQIKDSIKQTIKITRSTLSKVDTEIERNIQKAKSHIQEAKEHIKKTEDNIIDVCNRIAVPTDEMPTLNKFGWKYVTSEQYEVWNKKWQIIYGPYGSGKTVLIQCKAADLALAGEKVLILLPTKHLMIKYKMFFDEYVPNIVEEGKDKMTEEEKRKWNSHMHDSGMILLVLFEILSNNTSLYDELAQTSHMFVEELLWSPRDPSDINFSVIFNFLRKRIQQKQNKYCIWIVPHLYLIVTSLLATSLMYSLKELKDFRNFNYLPVTLLNTTWRTTKQIHDFMIQKEWEDFCKYKFNDDKLNKLIFCNEIFRTVLCNSHGHYISGPPVRIFNFTACAHDDKESILEGFLNFSAEVIISEVDRHRVLKFNPKDMAVIVDTCIREHIRIKHSFINMPLLENYPNCKFSSLTDEEYMKSEEIVAICNSDDIASFEWPVVIHVKYPYDFNYRFQYSGLSGRLTYFESYHHMIASRCTVQYVIIECKHEGDAYAWPHNKSFHNFNLWCEKNTRSFDAKAYHEYSES